MDDNHGTPQVTRSVTDATGHFDLLPHGKTTGRNIRVSLLIVTPDLALSPYAVRMEDARRLQLQLREPIDADVLVLDPTGQPTAGLALQPFRLIGASSSNPIDYVLQFPSELAQRFGEITDRNGVCRFKRMPKNAHMQVSITDQQFARPSMEERISLGEGASSERTTIKLLPAATIAGRVIFKESGLPATGVRVGAQECNGERGTFVWGDAVTDATGHYVLKQLRPGQCNVALDLADSELEANWTAKAHENIRVSAGQHLDAVNFELIPGTVITGRAIARDTGAPVPNVDIAVYGPAHPRSSAWVQATLTNRDGRYLLRVPPGGQYVYFRTAPPEFGKPDPESHELELIDGETRTLDFVLPPR